MEVVCRECGTSNFSGCVREPVVVVIHPGHVEVYGDRVQVQVIQTPYVQPVPVAEVMLQELIERILPRRFRSVMYPLYMKHQEVLNVPTVSEVLWQDKFRATCQGAINQLRELNKEIENGKGNHSVGNI